jgi:hypothetical protein
MRAWWRFYIEEVPPPVRERRGAWAQERYSAIFAENPE